VAIDFDGSNDSAIVSTEPLGGGTFTNFFCSIWVKRDADTGLRNIIEFFDSSNPLFEYIILFQNGPTLSLRAVSGGAAHTVSVGSFSANAWHCVQIGADKANVSGPNRIALRFDTTGAFTDGEPADWPTNMDSIRLGVAFGSLTPGYFNGALAELHLSRFSLRDRYPGEDKQPDTLMERYTPLHILPQAAYWAGVAANAGYWPMRNVNELADEINGYPISYPGVNPATNRGEHPKIITAAAA